MCDGVEDVSYFPSYEIVMDELRDYRWFAADMLHPSDPAIDYVTQRLLETRFDARDDAVREAVTRIRRNSRGDKSDRVLQAARAT